MSANKCMGSCFECPYWDCIISNTEDAPQWEKDFNRAQRKIRREKKNKKVAGSGSPGNGTLLSLRLRSGGNMKRKTFAVLRYMAAVTFAFTIGLILALEVEFAMKSDTGRTCKWIINTEEFDWYLSEGLLRS